MYTTCLVTPQDRLFQDHLLTNNVKIWSKQPLFQMHDAFWLYLVGQRPLLVRHGY